MTMRIMITSQLVIVPSFLKSGVEARTLSRTCSMRSSILAHVAGGIDENCIEGKALDLKEKVDSMDDDVAGLGSFWVQEWRQR